MVLDHRFVKQWVSRHVSRVSSGFFLELTTYLLYCDHAVNCFENQLNSFIKCTSFWNECVGQKVVTDPNLNQRNTTANNAFFL